MTRLQHERSDYRTGILSSPLDIAPEEWDALLAASGEPTPFLSHAFLAALHRSGSATATSGWTPRFVTLSDAADRLVAAAPLYIKDHSYGEYVFDWAWADAYQRNGLAYYPKLVSAVPFTPVQGSRLLAIDEAARRQLAATLLALAEQSEVSSLHVLFPTEHEADLFEALGMMRRETVQFHWRNAGYRSFDDFLATLEQKKRKNIRAERRKVADAGVRFRRVPGAAASDDDWRFFARCYRQTYREHHSTPYLNLAFFREIGESLRDNLLLVIAERDGVPIASSLAVYRRDATGGGTLYGRYWGALDHVPCLHFETAYYQLIDFCIEAGLDTFEGGAQGEHKLARGFLPTVTHSAHWLAHTGFADAIARYLARETAHMHAYVDELREHDPFRAEVR